MKIISFPGTENQKIKLTFEEFYKAYYKKVLFFLNKRLDNMTEAEDLASNIFLYAYRIYDTYDPSKSAPQTWIFTITRTRLINYYRDHHIDVDISELENVLTYEETEMEKAAYDFGGGNYMAPAQLVGDFLRHEPSRGPGRVKPSFSTG